MLVWVTAWPPESKSLTIMWTNIWEAPVFRHLLPSRLLPTQLLNFKVGRSDVRSVSRNLSHTWICDKATVIDFFARIKGGDVMEMKLTVVSWEAVENFFHWLCCFSLITLQIRIIILESWWERAFRRITDTQCASSFPKKMHIWLIYLRIIQFLAADTCFIA